MSPRKTILRELDAFGPDQLKKPSDINGFAERAPKYREAVNALLRDQLISGTQDSSGNLVIGLNAHRIADVRKELRPWFAAPLVWASAIGVVALGFVLFFG